MDLVTVALIIGPRGDDHIDFEPLVRGQRENVPTVSWPNEHGRKGAVVSPSESTNPPPLPSNRGPQFRQRSRIHLRSASAGSILAALSAG